MLDQRELAQWLIRKIAECDDAYNEARDSGATDEGEWFEMEWQQTAYCAQASECAFRKMLERIT